MKPRTSVIGLALLAILALLSWAQTPSAKGVLPAAADVFSVAAQTDDKVKPVMPLKIVEQGGGYRLYAGKSFVVVKAQ